MNTVKRRFDGVDFNPDFIEYYIYTAPSKEMYGKAQTQEERDYWHNVAEKERARAGYSGGTDGSFQCSYSGKQCTEYGKQQGSYVFLRHHRPHGR